MAYAAVVSLKHTIDELMHDTSEISVAPSSTQIIQLAYKKLDSILTYLKTLEKYWGTNRFEKALDEGLREELCKFENVIDSHVSNQLLSQSQSQSRHADVQDLSPVVRSFAVALKKIDLDYKRESYNMNYGYDDGGDGSSTLIDSAGGNKPTLVGYNSDQIPFVKGMLMLPDGIATFSLVGMAGIGKTALANQIFEDPDIREHFECRAWVRCGRGKCNLIEIAAWILAQLNPADSDKLATQGGEEISRDFQKCLESKKCLIVLDDVWDTGFIDAMGLKDMLCGSRVLLTTRLHTVVGAFEPNLKMQLLNKEKSWHLFCDKVFCGGLCPPERVKPGKKIVEKCEGLPLLIVTVANLLSKTDNNLECWNEIAEDKQNRFLKDACKEIEEVLFPSYDNLPLRLKTCFLYMGVFPQGYEIPKSKIINLWTAERLLEQNIDNFVEDHAMKLNQLVWNNVLLIYKKTTLPFFGSEVVKTCGLHCSFWHMCNREAEKNKFLHVLNNVEDGLEECIEGHRRLCIHNNVLFGIKDVYNSIERVCESTARSLLCFGPYNQYEVPMCFGLRLLKVLDSLAIRFYDFPLEVLKLVLLRYLALTCNGKLPSSIAELRRLELLIIGRHLSIKSNRAPSYVPREIWDIKELQHLQIMGRDLPDPCGRLLPKLLKLIGVSAHSCTKEVFEGIPRLEKLGILIELEPNATGPLLCFDHISNLNELESLKCVVVNPMFDIPPAAAPFSMMSSSLNKLHLSGLGYPWEYMTTLAASLPNLTELKLRCYAFRGPQWEIQDNQFPQLDSLLIEDTDLVQLKAQRGGFEMLRRLSLKHCYRLRELHLQYCEYLEHFELADLHPAAVIHIHRSVEDKLIFPEDDLVVHYSWKDGNLKSSQATNWPKRKFLKPL